MLIPYKLVEPFSNMNVNMRAGRYAKQLGRPGGLVYRVIGYTEWLGTLSRWKYRVVGYTEQGSVKKHYIDCAAKMER